MNWVEFFTELTEDERRLGQLPGFTPKRIEQWLETYPIEELGLPNHTGAPPNAPLFIARVCGRVFHIRRLRFGQARAARSSQVAQALDPLQRCLVFQ